jgi:hypothetical protein
VLANFGQHMLQQPSGFAKNFEPGLIRSTKALASLTPSQLKRFVWYETPLFPYDSGGFVRGYKDGRTMARIGMINRLFNQEMTDLEVPIAPLFYLSLAFYTSFSDRAHFPRHVYVQSARVAFSAMCSE